MTRNSTKPIKRCVRVDYRTGDQVGFKTKSFTLKDGTEYFPAIDVCTGEFHCTCKGSFYRPSRACSHVIRAGLNLIRKGQLDPAWLHRAGKKCCHVCGTENGLFEMCEDDGTPKDNVWTCRPCLPQAQPRDYSTEEVRANAEIEPFPHLIDSVDMPEVTWWPS